MKWLALVLFCSFALQASSPLNVKLFSSKGKTYLSVTSPPPPKDTRPLAADPSPTPSDTTPSPDSLNDTDPQRSRIDDILGAEKDEVLSSLALGTGIGFVNTKSAKNQRMKQKHLGSTHLATWRNLELLSYEDVGKLRNTKAKLGGLLRLMDGLHGSMADTFANDISKIKLGLKVF